MSEFEKKILANVPSIPATLTLTCSWACTGLVGSSQQVSYRKDIGRKNGGSFS